MSDDLLVTTVRSQTTGIPGRSLNSARTNHFIIDASSGPNEALNSGEAFLAGISSCGVNLVEALAREAGVPLEKAVATIEGRRSRSDPATFLDISLRFELAGPTQEQAEQLVEGDRRR